MKKRILPVIAMAVFSATSGISNAQWAAAPQAFQWQTVDCMSFAGNTGYVGGENGALAKTTNGGASWTQLTAPTQSYIPVLCFLDANTGFLTGSDELYKTTNGGVSWSLKHSLNNKQYRSIKFINSTTGFAVGGEGGICLILKTTDAGETWTEMNNGGSFIWLEDIDFPTATTGFAVGLAGTVMKTTDGGNNWSTVRTNTEYLNDVSFADASTGYVAGDSGVVLKTTNGGTTWTNVNIGTDYNIQAMHFIDASTGYVAVYAHSSAAIGKIFKTTNGGATWTEDYSQQTGSLMSMRFTSPTTAYAGGIIGGMVKMGAVAGLDEMVEGVITASPNPSNDGIFTLNGLNDAESSFEVRDLSGHIVAQSAKTATVDLSGNAPGVYVVTVSNPNGMFTARLIRQ